MKYAALCVYSDDECYIDIMKRHSDPWANLAIACLDPALLKKMKQSVEEVEAKGLLASVLAPINDTNCSCRFFCSGDALAEEVEFDGFKILNEEPQLEEATPIEVTDLYVQATRFGIGFQAVHKGFYALGTEQIPWEELGL